MSHFIIQYLDNKNIDTFLQICKEKEEAKGEEKDELILYKKYYEKNLSEIIEERVFFPYFFYNSNFRKKYYEEATNAVSGFENNYINYIDYITSFKKCNINMIKWLLSNKNISKCVKKSKWTEYASEPFTETALENSAYNGRIDIIKFLRKGKKLHISIWMVDVAAINGQFDTVKYLLKISQTYLSTNSDSKCYFSINAMDFLISLASEKGYLNIIKYVYKLSNHIPIGALTKAKENGHMTVYKYLERKYKKNE